MKTNHIIRRLLFLAALCISSSDALIRFAIDPTSCSAGGYENFLLAKLRRVSTIGKFMSLNLGNSDSQGFLRNPWKWQLDGHINDQIKLLMGDTQDALYQAQWVYGGAPTMSTTGLAGISTRISKEEAGPFDVVMYCDPTRLGLSPQIGKVLDPDASTAIGRDVVFEANVETGCNTNGGTAAPAYIFWQVGGDAARISFCPWYLNQAIRSEGRGPPSDTRRISQYLTSLYTYFGAKLWSQSPSGLPSIDQFQLFDGTMISALTHMRVLGGRQPTPQQGQPTGDSAGAIRGSLATWADVVSAATVQATRYTSGAYVFLMLAIFSYRSGFGVNGDGKLDAFIKLDANAVGVDWGNPSNTWALEWEPPFAPQRKRDEII